MSKMKFIGGIMGEKNKKWLEEGKNNSRNFPQGQRIYDTKGDSAQLNSQGGGWGAKTGLYMKNRKIRRLIPIECERLQGFPDNWTEGIPETQRYATLGNAVTVDVVEAIGKKLCGY